MTEREPETAIEEIEGNRQFVDLWARGENSFYEDPRNAVLTVVEDGEAAPEDVVVVLREPRLHRDVLTYTIQVLEASLPARSGPCSLFIDPPGRPLSPASLAGMRRRARRRAGRRA